MNVHLLEAEPEEAGPSHGTYIIPITDITIETSSDAALDAAGYETQPVTPQSPTDCQEAQEVTSSEETQEAEQRHASSNRREEEEESCL